MTLSLVLFAISATGILSVFALYPLLVWLLSLGRAGATVQTDGQLPLVSMLVVVRNGGRLMRAKLENALALDYPRDSLEIVVYSDGSTDDTEAVAAPYRDAGSIKLLVATEHKGKTAGINQAILSCTGEIVLFSDADALLDRDALKLLVSHFRDKRIGGVCGQRVISKDDAELKEAQHRFIRFDSRIKQLESRIGSISSNDGKIYAIRRTLFQPIAEAVTDDLYACLTIVRQHYRFVFEPAALAYIKVPSRNRQHELSRRRRIVCRGLRGIYLMRDLLNPSRYGFYSVSIFCNKILRRALPFFIILLVASSALLSFEHAAARMFLAAQASFFLLAMTYPLARLVNVRSIEKLSSTAFYFCVGNIGSFLGVMDFLRGRRVVQWNPVKQDVL